MAKKKHRHSMKTDQDWVLSRPASFIGAITEGIHEEYILDENIKKFVKTEISYVPALVKIINEIIDNSVDAPRGNKKLKIDITINGKTITCKDNGVGIPIDFIKDLDGQDIIIPKACWGKMKSGSNYNDDEEDATTIGTNGVGSFACNVWSTSFIGKTCDGKQQYIGTWKNNAMDYTEVITKKNCNSGTIVEFIPDLERFGIQGDIPNSIYQVIKQRLINLSATFKDITFSFNKEVLQYTNEQFLSFLGDNGNMYTTDKYSIAIFPSTSGDFECFSIINGLNLKGGTHIDYILKYMVSGIKDKLPKKFDSIKPGDIKTKLKIVIIGNSFPTIVWDGQTKEKIKNSDKDIRIYLGDDWKEMIPKVASNKDIIEPITFLHQAKIDAEEKRAAADADKEVKKSKVLKFRPATKSKTYLSVVEGDSALKGIIKALTREHIGYLPLRGVVINVNTSNMSKIVSNKEFKDLMNVLGLKFNAKNNCLEMVYDYIVIMTDADVDGQHIQGLLQGFFAKFIPNIFAEKRLLVLKTPIKVAKDKKENMVAAFLNEDEYKEFISKKTNTKYDIEYKKGLGSMNPKEYEQFFKLRPFETCLQVITYEDEIELDTMSLWLDDDADVRKEKMQNRLKNGFDIDAI